MTGLQDSWTEHDVPLTDACVRCGVRFEQAWVFCGRCGAPSPRADVVTTPDDVRSGPLPSAPTSPARRVTRWGLGVLIGSLLVAGGWGWVKHDNVSESLEATRAELTSTEARLNFSEETLEAARAKFKEISLRLRDTRAELTKSEGEIERVQGEIASAQDRLDLQANQIATLRTCLDGVSRALSYAAYMQYGLALKELNAVEVACQRAEDVL